MHVIEAFWVAILITWTLGFYVIAGRLLWTHLGAPLHAFVASRWRRR